MTVTLDQPPELLWGSFALCTSTDPDVPWQCTTLATTEFGNAVPIIEFIESSLIVDGGEAVVTGWERRTFTVAVRITAPDGQAMAQAQNALFELVRAEEKPALLWTPPMVGAWTGAFDVIAVKFLRKYDVSGGWDHREKHSRQRVFELEFTTKTWVRDPEPIEVPALPTNPPDPIEMLIDACESTVGWTQTSPGFGPTVKKNLMPTPSFETGLGGWAAGSGAATFTQDGNAVAGALSAFARSSSTSPAFQMYVNSPAVAVDAGKSYVIALSQELLTDPRYVGGVLVRFYSDVAGTNQIGSDLDRYDRVFPMSGWSSWVAAYQTAPAGARSMRIFPYAERGTPRPGATYDYWMWVDAVYIAETPDEHPYYFDGDTPDTSQWIYSWAGTPHASVSLATSTVPATTLTTSGGHIDLTASSSLLYSGLRKLTLTRSGAVSVAGLPYLRVSLALTQTGGTVELQFKMGQGTATPITPLTVVPSTIAGYSDYYFAASNFDTFTIEAIGSTGTPTVTISVAHIAATNRYGTFDPGGFQISRQITIEGAAPTGAAINFDAGTSPLIGSTALIYTGPSEVIPMRTLDSGVPPGRTADPTMMSGAWNTLNGNTVSLVPVARLSESKYDLLGRLNFTGTARVYWSARLVSASGTDIPGSDVVRSGDILLRNDTADPWKIHTIATIAMPVIKIDGPSGHKVEVKVWMASGGAAVKLDERWLVDRRGAVTLVHEPSTFQLTKVEVRSPQLGAPRYEVIGTWLGYGSQDISRITRVGRHRFAPGLLHVFTATDLAKYAGCSLRYHRTYPNEPGPALPVPAEA